jgi:nitronate monooxygenase
MRAAAAARSDTRFMALWAGQAAGMARDITAAELVGQLVREAENAAVDFTA